MIAPAEALREALSDVFEERYDSAVVYADTDGETILHEGPVRIKANGWLELPSGRLLSPESVHHVDTYEATD